MSALAAVPAGRPRQLAYLGTPAMAVPPLRALVAAGFEVAVVVTRADARRGRGATRSPSPVKQAASDLGLRVSHDVDDVLAAGVDLGVVVAFGRLVKPHVLAEVPMVNLHFSLLPRWRGAAPAERALLAGDDVTGVCLMQLEEGLDTGPVFAREEVPVEPDDTGDSLRARLVEVGTTMLVRELSAGLGPATPQEGEPTYAAKLTTDDLRLDWAAPGAQRHRVVRLGGAWTTFRAKRLRVLAADLVDAVAIGDTLAGDGDGVVGGLRLVTVQPEGKGAMPWADFARGARPLPGERLGT